MKKVFGSFMVIAILFSSMSFAYAASTDEDSLSETVTVQEKAWAAAEAAYNAKVEAAKEYAYRDISEATPAEKAKIMDARNTIIYSQGWVADGYELALVKADGTVENMPKFSELFPDWDIPVLNVTGNIDDAVMMSSTFNERNSSSSYYYYLKNPTSTNTAPFCSFYHTGGYVNTYVNSLSSSQTCNIGYNNMGNGASLGWLPNLYPGDSCYLDTLFMSSFTCGVRASTYSSPGYGTLTVSHDATIWVK